MFYSHQLLVRKAPLGQIWMAATMRAKINRKKLDRLNIINICEEILNPSIPMALRLSGILMGGVVIVYERKVKLLYDDVTRLLVKINEAWKVKPAGSDPTALPKGKSQAKKQAVTLPENQDADVGDIEQSVNFSNSNATMDFQRTSYFAMRLDDVDETFISNDLGEENVPQQFHQADPDNIKLSEHFDLYRTHTEIYNRYESFDIEEDEETQMKFTSGEHVEIQTSLIPFPPKQDEAPRADEIQDQEKQINPQAEECKVAKQNQKGKEPVTKKDKKQPAPPMDYEQTIIPGPVYQSWLQNVSDIRRGRKRKARRDIMSTMKAAKLMELPPLVLIDDLFTNANREIYYPAPLLELWMKCTQPQDASPSARSSAPLPPEPSSSSLPERGDYQDPTGYRFEDFQSGMGPIEKRRKTIINEVMPMEILTRELRENPVNSGSRTTEANLTTPGNSVAGDEARSIPRSGSGHGMPSHQSEVHSGRLGELDILKINGSNRKRPYSGSRHSGSSLEPVEEEHSWHFPDPNFKIARLSEKDLTPDPELLVETGPTQTQHPIINQPVDTTTDSIRTQIKTNFETPGSPAVESLNKLAAGMNRKGAAMLFYQTCVLASRDCLRVEQKVPYGEILISKGKKL